MTAERLERRPAGLVDRLSPVFPSLRRVTRRRAGAGVLAAVVAAAVAGCDRPGDASSHRADLEEIVAARVSTMSPSDPYRDPQATERTAARDATGMLLAGGDPSGAEELLDGIGYRVVRGVDTVDDRAFTFYLADVDTGWAGLLVDPSGPIRLVIEVPHPAYDLNTETLGVGLFRQLPGSAMLIAGAFRQAADDEADVAHNDRSMFQVFSEVFAEHQIAQLQLHGFAQSSLPGADAVVSTGSAPHDHNDLAERIARELKAEDLRTCRAWVSHCVGLEGTTNVQGAAAGEQGAEFVHLELGWSLRRDQPGRGLVQKAVVAAWNG